MSKYTADEVRGYAGMFWGGNKDERIASMMLHEYADILSGRVQHPNFKPCPENMLACDMGCTGGWCVTLHGSPLPQHGREEPK